MLNELLEAGMAVLDWSKCPAVESVQGKMSGAWVLKGTRMPVSAVFENLEAGASIDDIMEWFDGLDRKQVQAVVGFAGAPCLASETWDSWCSLTHLTKRQPDDH